MDLGDEIIVANSGDNSLSIIDCHSWVEKRRIYMPLGSGPYTLAKTKDKSRILVSQCFSDSLLCVDLQQKRVEKSLILGRRPSYMVFDTSKNTLYITNADSNSISIVTMDDEIRLVGQVTVGAMPQGIDCDSEGEILAVANTHSNSIYFINTSDYKIINTSKLQYYPYQIKFSLDGRKLYVGNFSLEKDNEGIIIVINMDDFNIDCKIPVKGMPGQIYVTRDGKYILVTSMGEGGLQIIDVNKRKVIENIRTNGMTHGIAVDIDEKYAWVTNADDSSVSIVDWQKGKRLTNIKVGKEPNGIIFISDYS